MNVLAKVIEVLGDGRARVIIPQWGGEDEFITGFVTGADFDGVDCNGRWFLGTANLRAEVPEDVGLVVEEPAPAPEPIDLILRHWCNW